MVVLPVNVLFLLCLQIISNLAVPMEVCYYKICACSEKSVDCNSGSDITELPQIPHTVQKLSISGVTFNNPVINNANLTTFRQLVSLKITRSNLQVIKPNTFQSFRFLRYLDLSRNKLLQIQPGTFNALILTALHIEQNPGIEFNTESFTGVSMDSLSLRGNNLKKIDFEVFKNLNLDALIVSENSIRNIDPRFKKIINKAPKIFDLSQNPINCSCTIAWLRSLITSVEAKKRGVKVVCSSPTVLEGRNLAEVLPEEIACPKPQIKSILIDLQPTTAELTCSASGQSAPNLRWTFQDGNTKKSVEKQADRMDKTGESRLVMNVTVTPEKKSYTCIVWAEEEARKQSVIISVRGPSRVYDPPNLHFTNSKSPDYLDRDAEVQSPSSPPDLLYEKQFNLLQMLGAVFGTFLCTSIVLGIIHYCIFYAKRQKALKKTYWSTHGSAYSATGSHEYDVPRIDPPTLPPPPPMNMYPRPNEIEFLDFKTQTKLYR